MPGDKIKGLACGALAAVTYGMNPLFTLPLYREGMTPETVLFFRYFFAALLLGAVMKWRKTPFALPVRQVVSVAIGGLLVALSSLLLFLSYQKMDAGIASTILFVYPVMVAVIMGVFFHEKITLSMTFGILSALAGVGILYKGGDGRPLNSAGLVLVLFSALSYAAYMVAIRESRLKELSSELMTFYVMVFGLPLFLIRANFGLELQWIPSLSGWGCVIALALFPTVCSFWLMAVAIRIIGATKTAVLGALEPATAVCIGVMCFGEQLTWRLMIGIAVILFAVTLVVTGKQLAFLNSLERSFGRLTAKFFRTGKQR